MGRSIRPPGLHAAVSSDHPWSLERHAMARSWLLQYVTSGGRRGNSCLDFLVTPTVYVRWIELAAACMRMCTPKEYQTVNSEQFPTTTDQHIVPPFFSLPPMHACNRSHSHTWIDHACACVCRFLKSKRIIKLN